MIKLQGISKSFQLHGQSLPILQVAEWQIQKGERIALMGAERLWEKHAITSA